MYRNSILRHLPVLLVFLSKVLFFLTLAVILFLKLIKNCGCKAQFLADKTSPVKNFTHNCLFESEKKLWLGGEKYSKSLIGKQKIYLLELTFVVFKHKTGL